MRRGAFLEEDEREAGAPAGIRTPTPRQELSPALVHILGEVRRRKGFHDGATTFELSALIDEVSKELGFQLASVERDLVLVHLESDEKPFGVLQELVDNGDVSDIICSSYDKIAVQQGRFNYETEVAFPNQEAYESFVEKLLLRAGTSYSTKRPITDGMLGGLARIHAVHRSITAGGPYLTIRLNRFAKVSIDDLVGAGMGPQPVLDYLASCVGIGVSILIVGEVGVGKTTLARALAGTIPEHESILVIEDTPEIRLTHPHVRYVTTREANLEGSGRVAPSEVIRGGMRMAMNRIIFGEMRDAEAAEAFVDVCASGHPGLSTIHGRSALDALTRLELFLGRAQRGVERAMLSEQIATAVSVICFVGLCPATRRRRILEVREVGPVSDGALRQREIFRYELHEAAPSWRVVHRVSAHRDALEQLPAPMILASYPARISMQSPTDRRPL